jgi:hypothetical protein
VTTGSALSTSRAVELPAAGLGFARAASSRDPVGHALEIVQE